MRLRPGRASSNVRRRGLLMREAAMAAMAAIGSGGNDRLGLPGGWGRGPIWAP